MKRLQRMLVVLGISIQIGTVLGSQSQTARQEALDQELLQEFEETRNLEEEARLERLIERHGKLVSSGEEESGPESGGEEPEGAFVGLGELTVLTGLVEHIQKVLHQAVAGYTGTRSDTLAQSKQQFDAAVSSVKRTYRDFALGNLTTRELPRIKGGAIDVFDLFVQVMRQVGQLRMQGLNETHALEIEAYKKECTHQQKQLTLQQAELMQQQAELSRKESQCESAVQRNAALVTKYEEDMRQLREELRELKGQKY